MAGTEATPQGARAAGTVRVWDLPVRLFHWSVAVLVLCSWITAENGWLKWHQRSGLAILTLLLFRIAWGFVGSTTARFSDFIRSPAQALAHLRAVARGEPQAHAGHNPAGGWMVLLLLATLLVQAVTGLYCNDGVRFNGPLAGSIASAASDRLTRLHGTLFNVILALVWTHVVAVMYYRQVRGESLLEAIFSGRKPRGELPGGPPLKFVALRWALAWLVLMAIVVAWITRS